MVDSDLERGRRAVSKAKRMPIVHVSHEQYPTPQSATLCLDISRQLCDKPQGLSLDDTPENGTGK